MANSHSEVEARRAQDQIVDIVTVVEELLTKARELAIQHGIAFGYTLNRVGAEEKDPDWNDSGCTDRY